MSNLLRCTDKQALAVSSATHKIQIGEKLTADRVPALIEVGRKSAEESRSQIEKILEGTDMVFVTAGMGGGTGTGGAPIIAEIAKSSGVLTVGVVTKPFAFEGSRRMAQAESGIEELRSKVDSLVIIPNERLKHATDQKITFANAFEIADDVLRQAVQSISDLIKNTGFINLDFADVTAIMKNAGYAHMGVGHAEGKTKLKTPPTWQFPVPSLKRPSKARPVSSVNVTGSMDIGLAEVETAANLVKCAATRTRILFSGPRLTIRSRTNARHRDRHRLCRFKKRFEKRVGDPSEEDLDFASDIDLLVSFRGTDIVHKQSMPGRSARHYI